MDKLIISEMPLSELKWVSHLAAGPGSTVMPPPQREGLCKALSAASPSWGKSVLVSDLE